MALKSFRPRTPVLRFKQLPAFDEITKSRPESSLLEPKKKSGGRNNFGRLTSRHIGGGHKQHYRKIDFKRRKRGVAAEVLGIEYDPNRSARIALIKYTDGELSYILAPDGLRVGASVAAGDDVAPEIGNALPLRAIPLGTNIHNIELTPGGGGKIARSAGQQAILNNLEAGYALVKMPSGEIRRIHAECFATIGQVGNVDHMNVAAGKAGRSRWLGITQWAAARANRKGAAGVTIRSVRGDSSPKDLRREANTSRATDLFWSVGAPRRRVDSETRKRGDFLKKKMNRENRKSGKTLGREVRSWIPGFRIQFLSCFPAFLIQNRI